jgi:hypothetical protein
VPHRVHIVLPSCGLVPADNASSDDGAITVNGAKETLHIVSGSENEELEPILRHFAQTV